MTQPVTSHPLQVFFYLLTAMLCGALIMVIEVLGSRVIGPFFGVSLFVWTSLISVTMIALALGYGVGGVLSDRFSHPRYLYLLILAAGILTLLIPVLKGPVLKACMPLGLRGGAFASSMALFGLPLLLLGCVSPYLVKVLARELHKLGRVVGGLYALSTVGSVIGTVLTGFVLVTYLGVDRILALTGLLLIGLSVVYLAFVQRVWLSLAVLILPLLLWPSTPAISKTLSDGTHVQLIHREDSRYGSIKVAEYSFGQKRLRELMIDGLVQGGVDMNTRQSVYTYPYLLQLMPYLANPSGKHALQIGLGAGTIPPWYQSRGIRVDVVDIDPAIVEVAKTYFGFQTNGSIDIADARYFLSTTRNTYDYILLDAFNGDITPGHLLSIEALRLVKSRLNRGGVVGINLIGSIRHETYITASIMHTLEQVFDQVEMIPLIGPNNKAGTGNIVVLAYQGAHRARDMRLAQGFSIHPEAVSEVSQALASHFAFPPGTPAMVLTDDFNPGDFYDLWLKEKVRNDIVAGVDWDILID